MPRAGLSTAVVVRDAADLADEVGLDRVTLAELAQRRGVALPSLYKHVRGLDALREQVAALATAELADVFAAAAAGRARTDAVVAVAAAYRDYARRYPGRYAASQRVPESASPEHVSAAERAVGTITAVLAGMSAGRFIGARISERRPIDWILLRSFAVVAAGFAVFWVASAAWLSYLGLVVCGLGIAMHYPLGVARAIASAPGQTDLASSRMSVASGIAIGGGPFLLAFLADTISVQWAYLLVPVLLLAATTTVLVSRRPAPVMPVAEAAAVPVP